MRTFPGYTRRIYITLPHGAAAHLFKRRKVSTGPLTFCGYIGGTERSYREVKRRDLCRTCARLAGVDRQAA